MFLSPPKEEIYKRGPVSLETPPVHVYNVECNNRTSLLTVTKSTALHQSEYTDRGPTGALDVTLTSSYYC